ncbi:MAG: ROK family protein [Bacillota bacterium]
MYVGIDLGGTKIAGGGGNRSAWPSAGGDTPNLPGWEDWPVAVFFREAHGCLVAIDNGVRAATRGEYLFGAGQGVRSRLCLTLGTGIGSGIILDGRLWRGYTQSAGEVGHITVDRDGPVCNCGNNGCLGQYASAPAIVRRARQALRRHPESLLWSLCGQDPDRLTATLVSQAADRGDPLPQRLWDRRVPGDRAGQRAGGAQPGAGGHWGRCGPGW